MFLTNAKNESVELIIEKDYDGYFELVAVSLIGKITNSKIKRVVLRAKPYAMCDVEYEVSGETLNLTYYSAIRAGFGSLHTTELLTEINGIQ